MKIVLALLAATALASSASAAVYTVDAFANSSSGGTGVSTISVVTGQQILVSAGVNDLWSAGALPRWSNADGLTTLRYATGTDDSGQPATTLIGQPFSNWTQANLSAPFGTLVGEIGGVYQALGTSFSGPAWGNGTLKLYYWDSNFEDNSGFISASVSVPEPASWAMLIAGFGLVGAAARRRRTIVAA
jgi:hypothetical protein